MFRIWFFGEIVGVKHTHLLDHEILQAIEEDPLEEWEYLIYEG